VARLVGLCLLAACALASAAAASTYPGTSKALMATPKEIGFTHLLAFRPAKKPAATLAQGYKNGVTGLFEKGPTTAPVEVAATVYVYSTSADAKLSWQHSCSKCTTVSAPQGILLKAEAGTSNKVPTLHEVTVCGNVYLDVLEEGTESAAKLDGDVAKVTDAIYSRAIHTGLSSCTTK
jgi:hypothetical protein